MWLFIFSSRQFEDTFEKTQWRKVEQMQPMWLCLCDLVVIFATNASGAMLLPNLVQVKEPKSDLKKWFFYLYHYLVAYCHEGGLWVPIVAAEGPYLIQMWVPISKLAGPYLVSNLHPLHLHLIHSQLIRKGMNQFTCYLKRCEPNHNLSKKVWTYSHLI